MLKHYVKYETLIVLLTSWVVMFLLSLQHNTNTIPMIDADRYLATANGLYEKNTFATVYPNVEKKIMPSMERAPLFPFFVSSLMRVDQTLTASVKCILKNTKLDYMKGVCEQGYGIFVPAQISFNAIMLLMVFLMAKNMNLSRLACWGVLLTVLVANEFPYYTVQFTTETLVFSLFSVFSYCLLRLWQEKTWSWFLLCGITLGLTSLTRPSFEYVFYVALVVFILAIVKSSKIRNKLITGTVLFTLSFSILVGGWKARNYVAHDNFALTDTYPTIILAQRAAYNEMTIKEYFTAFIYWLPDFGDSLSAKWFEESSYKRLDFYDEEGFYNIANTTMWDLAKADANGNPNNVKFILNNYILNTPVKHVLVTIPLTFRGMFVGKYWSFVTLTFFFFVFFYALKSKWCEFLIISIPPWFMLGFHAFVSVSIPRYNLAIIPCLAIAFVWCLEQIYKKKTTTSEQQLKLARQSDA